MQLESMLGKQGKVSPITSTSSQEEIAAFRRATGVPDKVEGYEITKPKDINGKPFPAEMWQDDSVQAYLAKFHELGVPKATAQELIKFGMEQGVNRYQSLSDIVQQARTTAETSLRKDWGTSYDANMAEAERGAQSLGLTKQMVEADPVLANNPTFIKMALAAAKMTKEGSSPGARGGQPGQVDPSARIGELQKMMSHPNYRRSAEYANHETHMAEMQRLVQEKHAARTAQ